MYIEIDANTRKIKITQEQRLFGVVQDCNAERKYFKMPRIVGNNIDVTNCIIYIVYQKCDEVGNIYYGEPNMYICEDVVLDETEQNVTFSWELKDIFDISGYLGFKILVECTDDDGNVKNVWNTIPEFGIIYKSMFGDKIHIQEQDKDIVNKLLQDLKQIKNDVKTKITQPSTAKVGQVLAVKSTDEEGKVKEVEAVDTKGASEEEVKNAVDSYLKEHPLEESDPTVPEWAKAEKPPTYTAKDVGALPVGTEIPKTASDVGADASGTAESKVSAHNVSDIAHNDIRLLVQGLTERLNALADSDDETLDQMSEVVAYIKSNKSLIDAITTSKVSVSDIIDNLTTSVSNKPLSAKQGVALKALIDEIAIPTKVSDLQNDSGFLAKPSTAKIGQIFRVQSINEDGTLVLEGVDAPSGGVSDVTVDGASIVGEDGTAIIPVAAYDSYGVVKLNVAHYSGLQVETSGGVKNCLGISPATENYISMRAIFTPQPIVPKNLDYAVKCAMTDGKGTAWTPEEQKAAQIRLGILSSEEVLF